MRCSIHSIKRVASHLITPVMRMVFNPTQLKTVTMEGESGTNDVRNAVYADSSSIVKEMQSSSKKDSNDYMNDPLLQELEYKTSYAYCYAHGIHVQGQGEGCGNVLRGCRKGPKCASIMSASSPSSLILCASSLCSEGGATISVISSTPSFIPNSYLRSSVIIIS